MSTILTEQEQNRIHAGLLNNQDPTAFLNAYDFLLDVLCDIIQHKYSNQPYEDCEDSVVEALQNYFQHPAQYDPAKASLITYLQMAADGDMRNLITKQKRREKHETISLDDDEQFDVADRLAGGNIDQQSESVEEQVERLLAMPRIESLLADLKPQDRQILMLIADRERDTGIFAEVLGIAHLGTEEQRKIVKREKDRLLKSLRRNISRDELGS